MSNGTPDFDPEATPVTTSRPSPVIPDEIWFIYAEHSGYQLGFAMHPPFPIKAYVKKADAEFEIATVNQDIRHLFKPVRVK